MSGKSPVTSPSPVRAVSVFFEDDVLVIELRTDVGDGYSELADEPAPTKRVEPLVFRGPKHLKLAELLGGPSVNVKGRATKKRAQLGTAFAAMVFLRYAHDRPLQLEDLKSLRAWPAGAGSRQTIAAKLLGSKGKGYPFIDCSNSPTYQFAPVRLRVSPSESDQKVIHELRRLERWLWGERKSTLSEDFRLSPELVELAQTEGQLVRPAQALPVVRSNELVPMAERVSEDLIRVVVPELRHPQLLNSNLLYALFRATLRSLGRTLRLDRLLLLVEGRFQQRLHAVIADRLAARRRKAEAQSKKDIQRNKLKKERKRLKKQRDAERKKERDAASLPAAQRTTNDNATTVQEETLGEHGQESAPAERSGNDLQAPVPSSPLVADVAIGGDTVGAPQSK